MSDDLLNPAERAGAVIALDNGDTLHGTYPAVQSRCAALLPLLNALDLDGMTAHWESAYGPAQFRTLASSLIYPVLATNCYEKATGELAFQPLRVVERGGLRVGTFRRPARAPCQRINGRICRCLMATSDHTRSPITLTQINLAQMQYQQ